MNRTLSQVGAARVIVAPAVALALLAGLALTTTNRGVEPPTPTHSPSAAFSLPPVLTVAAEEDEPGWRCEYQGNRRCGITDPEMAADAWSEWDNMGGAARLLTNPHAKVTLTGYMVQDPYVKGGPALGVHEIALPIGASIWYVFTAQAI